jgi:putative ABC transport system substrate-binding protein
MKLNKNMKKILTSVFGITLAISLSACGGGASQSATTPAEPEKKDEAPAAEEKALTIGVTQIIEHPALDAAKKGFIDYLNENGFAEGEKVTYDFQSAQGSMDTATSIAQKFTADKVDMILAIATPTAQTAAQATKDIPILITAVTDPVSAKIVQAMDKPGANVTGTTDMNPIKEQLELIKEVLPEAKKVGVLYNSGETNSIVQIEIAKEFASQMGLELVERAVTNSSEVKQAAESLPKVDAIYVPTDNTVVSALEAVLMVGEKAKVPVFAAESESVSNGAIMTYGLDYYKLGRQTGEMAVKILKGEAKPADLPIESQKDLELIINKKAAERFGVEIPQSVIDRADQIIE